MKKTIFLLLIFLNIPFAKSQDCIQDDGTYQYRTVLNIENLPADFNKSDFIIRITEIDIISNDDLAILNDNITSVFKTIPSYEPSKYIAIVATIEIYTILDSLENSLDFLYCLVTDCEKTDGTFKYMTALTLSEVPNDFNKDDFINFVVNSDTISPEDLATLNAEITSVYKAFPSSQNEFLLRVVSIDATSEIYAILDSLVNSVEFIECDSDEVILSNNDMETEEKFVVYPNPITEESVIKFSESNDYQLEFFNNLGQLIYQENISNSTVFNLKNVSFTKGLYFVKIYNLTNGNTETLKLINK
ncbi:MAG: T9SS type A sorting domain-containing protein [Flavobacteriaceae bacterium]|nr:T9SS type A sorting domain-containing protein [Flavobacteriaceae bacterium]